MYIYCLTVAFFMSMIFPMQNLSVFILDIPVVVLCQLTCRHVQCLFRATGVHFSCHTKYLNVNRFRKIAFPESLSH